tara:strand:- start:3197 stop:4438 length:1242 start_codon:yes stop_codon:yes gene_type:complete
MCKINSYLFKELENLPFGIFNLILEYSQINDVKIAIVGGYIRDLLIKKIHKKQTGNFIDLDIIIEGSSLSLAKFIKKNIKNVELCLIKEFDLYNTVELNIEDIKVDIASAREEIYLAPGLNPSVKDSTIKADLKRRDFSINAMAFEIQEQELYDLFDGLNHIKNKELHFLHGKSVEDDPSRILRGAKYASRLNFNISEESLTQAQNSIKEWPWKSSENESRIKFPPSISIRLRMELSEILNNDNLSVVLINLYEWDVISLINKNIKVNKKFLRGLSWIKRLNGNLILFLLKDSESLKEQCERFYVNKKEKAILDNYFRLKNIIKIESAKYKDYSPSQWTKLIEENHIDSDAIKLLICDGGLFWKPFFKWLFRYKNIKSNKDGTALMKEGWFEGKAIGEELKRLRYLQIDNLKK